MPSLKALSFVLLFFSLCCVAQESPFTEGNFTRFQKKQKRKNSMYMVYYYADWCAPCKEMNNSTFQDSELQRKFRSRYASFKINAYHAENRTMAADAKVHSLPTFVFYNHKGKEIDRLIGFQSADELLSKFKSYHKQTRTRVSYNVLSRKNKHTKQSGALATRY